MIEELNGDFLQWLRGFYHVARTGSVRKAAELMHRNPSTISYQLKCLEEELNVVLFDRIKKTLKITEEGKRLLGWTISTFETLKSLRSAVGNTNGRIMGPVRMATTMPVLSVTAQVFAQFIRDYPLVNVHLERDVAGNISQMVEDSEVDFGILPFLHKREGVEVIFRARPLLIFTNWGDRQIPLAPTVRDLAQLPFIALDFLHNRENWGYTVENTEIGEVMAQNAIISVNNNHIMLRLICTGIGVGIMDELCFEANKGEQDAQQLQTVPLDHLLPSRLYCLLTREGRRLSPQSLELIKALRAFFAAYPAMDRPTARSLISCEPTTAKILLENGIANSNGN